MLKYVKNVFIIFMVCKQINLFIKMLFSENNQPENTYLRIKNILLIYSKAIK